MRRFCRNIIGLESLGGGGVWQEKYKCKRMEAGKRETIMELWTCKVPERTSRRYRAAGRQGWVRRNWDFTPQGWSFPGGSSGEESACQCRRWRFELWIGKIPWRRKWQPTAVFLPEKHWKSVTKFSPEKFRPVGGVISLELGERAGL